MTQSEARPDELSDALPNGSTIGGYAVRRLLGQGGFGITYEADNRVTGRSVAIKEFFPASLVRRGGASQLVYAKSNEETVAWALRKFEETTTTLCKLSHPNIVQVINYVPANNTGYMIMELLHGRTFKDWLKARERAPPTLDELRPLLAPVMDALTYVHGQGLVHRDVAPDNILITGEDRPVLIDFGSVSADLSRAGQEKASSTVGLTKRHYTAPEQMSTRARPGAPADIYSVGAVLYRALCGEEPADGQDRVDAIFLHQEPDPYRSMAGMRPSPCAPTAAALIDRSLDMRPEKRPASMAELRNALWSQVSGGGVGDAGGKSTGTTGLTPGPADGSTTKWIAIAVAIVAVACIAGLLVYKWLDDQNRRELARPQAQTDRPQSDNTPSSGGAPPPPTSSTSTEAPRPQVTERPSEPPPRSETPPPPPVEVPAPQPSPPVIEPSPTDDSTPRATSCTVTGLDANGNNWLALRNQPSLQSSWSATRMGPGTVVSSIGRSGEWRHVRLATGETGWANGRYLACGVAAPAARVAPASSSCTVGGLDPNGDNWLALRHQPSFQSTWSSTRMGPGTRLTVTGRSGDWLHVRLPSGEAGWANGKFVFCSE